MRHRRHPLQIVRLFGSSRHPRHPHQKGDVGDGLSGKAFSFARSARPLHLHSLTHSLGGAWVSERNFEPDCGNTEAIIDGLKIIRNHSGVRSLHRWFCEWTGCRRRGLRWRDSEGDRPARLFTHGSIATLYLRRAESRMIKAAATKQVARRTNCTPCRTMSMCDLMRQPRKPWLRRLADEDQHAQAIAVNQKFWLARSERGRRLRCDDNGPWICVGWPRSGLRFPRRNLVQIYDWTPPLPPDLQDLSSTELNSVVITLLARVTELQQLLCSVMRSRFEGLPVARRRSGFAALSDCAGRGRTSRDITG